MSCFVTWTVMLSLAAASPEKLLDEIQRVYSRGGDLSAHFTQTYRDKLRGKERRESGRLWGKSDGRVRWTYEEPTRKDFVFDGRTAYFYEPDSAQVTVFEQFSDSPIYNAMRFLWGQGRMPEAFTASYCKEGCGPTQDDELVLQLTPKKPIASVEQIQLVVAKSRRTVRRSAILDSLGNRTEYRFSDVQFSAEVAEEKFLFVRPPGVSEVRATMASDTSSGSPLAP